MTVKPLEGESPLTSEEVRQIRVMIRALPIPWWKNHALMIAGAGFLLALVTAAVSAYVGYRKDIHDRQAQLATTLQTMQEVTGKIFEKQKPIPSPIGQAQLPREQQPFFGGPNPSGRPPTADMPPRVPGAPPQTHDQDPSVGMGMALVNTLLRRGVELALGLGTEASTGELIILAEGTKYYGQYMISEQLLNLALETAQNANDASIALRKLGQLKLLPGTTAAIQREGEEYFSRATKLDSKYTMPPHVVPFLKAIAELEWADAIAPLDCAGARRRFNSATGNIQRMLPSPERESLEATVAGIRSAGWLGRDGKPIDCKPTPVTAP